MSFVVTCTCGQSFSARPELAGKQVACPVCGAALRIPGPTSAAPVGPKPATLPVTCSCGQSFRAKPELVGKQVACPACGATLRIPSPTSATAIGAMPPTLVVTCSCGQSFRARSDLAGQRVACPVCRAPLQVPGAAPLPAPAEDPLGLGGVDLASLGTPRPRRPAPGGLQLPARKSAKRRSKRDFRVVQQALMVGGGIAVAVAACLVVVFVLRQFLWVHRTPEAVFAAAKRAVERDDWKAFCGCLTPASRDVFAGMLVKTTSWVGAARSVAANFNPDGGQAAEAKLKPVLDVMERHGLDEETLRRMHVELPMSPGPNNVAQLDKALAPIRDRDGFIADMIAAFKQVGNQPRAMPLETDSQLENVKIEGETATAAIVRTGQSKGMPQSITFQLIGGSWKIDLFKRDADRDRSFSRFGGP